MITKEFFNLRYEIHALPIITEILETLLEFGDLKHKPGLDVGCGWGWFLHYANKKGINMYGFEIHSKLLEKALIFGVRTDRLLISDVQHMPFKEKAFEFILCWHVLEHISDHQKALTEIQRILKTGGILILGVPNDATVTNLIFKLFRLLLLKGIDNYFTKNLAFYDPTHLREYKLSSLLNMLINDFHIIKFRFDFLSLPIFRIFKLFKIPPLQTKTLIKIGKCMPHTFKRSIEIYAKKK